MALNELACCVERALEVTETGSNYDEIHHAALTIHSKRLRRTAAEPYMSKNHALQTLMTSRDECLPLADAILIAAKERHTTFRGLLDVYLEWSKTAVAGEGGEFKATFVPGRGNPQFGGAWSKVCSVSFRSKRAWALFVALKPQWHRMHGAPEFYSVEIELPSPPSSQSSSSSSSSLSTPFSSASVSVPLDKSLSTQRSFSADARVEPTATKPLPPSSMRSWYDLATEEEEEAAGYAGSTSKRTTSAR